MLGQHHQFHHYNPGKSKFGEERYFKISKRIYRELDERLSESKFLSGNDYTIADIGTFPWIARHEWHDIGLAKHKHLTSLAETRNDSHAAMRVLKPMFKYQPPWATMPTILDCVLWFKRIAPCYTAQGPTFILKGGREFYNMMSSINRVIHTAPTTSSPLMCLLLLASYRSESPIACLLYTSPSPRDRG